MFDYMSVIVISILVISVSLFYLHLRFLTACALGLVIGTVVAGLVANMGYGSEEFDSPRLKELQQLYSFMAHLSVIAVILHLLAAVIREARTRS